MNEFQEPGRQDHFRHAAACLSLVTAASDADPQTVPVPLALGTLADGTYSRAWALNDRGQVVGFSTVSPGPPMRLGLPFHHFRGRRRAA
jgi:hypothetical protein